MFIYNVQGIYFFHLFNIFTEIYGVYTPLCAGGYEDEQKHLSHVQVASAVLNAYVMTK